MPNFSFVWWNVKYFQIKFSKHYFVVIVWSIRNVFSAVTWVASCINYSTQSWDCQHCTSFLCVQKQSFTDVLQNRIFTWEHLCWSLFLTKLQAWRPYLKKRLQHRCFLVIFETFLKIPFLQNTSGGCSYVYINPFNICITSQNDQTQVHLNIKCIRHKVHLKSVFDHFGTLCIRGSNQTCGGISCGFLRS